MDLLAQTEIFDWILKGGVPLVLLVCCYLLGRYFLQREAEHKQALKERNDQCGACRAKWEERENEALRRQAETEREYRGKVEALLREQISWQQDMFEVADGPAEGRG